MNESLYSLVSAIMTRVGALILLTYGSQVLISLYKYNMRLSAFNDSIADAIDLNDGIVNSDLIKLFEKMDSSKIGFGNDIKTPTSEVLNLLKEVLKSKVDAK